MLIITQTALELGFLYALVAMALFLSYRILDIADLTTDGCFVLGAAVSVTVTAAGHPVLAIFAAMLAGACAGFVTAFLQTKLGVPSILAGIVTNTGLYTVNLMAMGWKSNQSLLGGKTVFTMLRETGIGGEWYELLLAAFVTLLAGLLLVLFLGTRMGLSIRATGDNPDMVRASSLNPSFTITVGLCLANMLTALSGAIVGQYQKTVDIVRRAEEIICVEATQRKVLVHTIDGALQSTQNMEYWRQTLALPCFYMTHRSYIVNLHFVNSIRKDTILLKYRGREMIAYLTKRRYVAFKDTYLWYMESVK